MHERIALIARHTDVCAAVDIAAAGFDTVLVMDAEFAPLANIASISAGNGLSTWLMLSPDEHGAPLLNADASSPLAPWMVDGDVALDPRRPPLSVRAGPVDDVDLAAWRAKIASATAAGVTGFVCRDADRLPASVWSALLAPACDVATTWTAWTVGLSSPAIAALVDLGFAAVCNSAAWWDGRSDWLVEESRRLRPARILSFPADPFACGSVDGLDVANRLAVAAISSDALLVAYDLFRDDAALRDHVVAVNRWIGARTAPQPIAAGALRIVSGPDAPITVVVRSPTFDLRAADDVEVLLINPSAASDASMSGASVTTAVGGFGGFEQVLPAGATSSLDPTRAIVLCAGELRVFRAARLPVIRRSIMPTRRATEAALRMPRLAIEAITPSVDGGRFPVKRTVGESVRVEADIVIDGHEKLGASLLYRAVGDRDWRQARMEPLGNDRFTARIPLNRIGRHEFTIEAWRDAFATYRNELDKKSAAGLDVSLELTEGALLIDRALAHAKTLKRPGLVKRLAALVKILSTATTPADRNAMIAKVAALLSSQTLADMQDADHRDFATRPDAIFPIDAERVEAGFASWYELFPRSLGNPPGAEAVHHGSFADVIDRLPAVRAMGFDVLYFPPIHPIGTRNRKGRNNSLTTVDGDPGSPYAIGSPDGGHDALHPQLGTFDDFRRLRDAALANGLELALDFAIQCSPDHPWLEQHPGWFAWRPDGSLRYAENPPKKYEDIVNVDFYGEGKRGDAAPALWAALRDVILLWVEHGVRIFRVDNPHTKPLPFWEWMIGEVRAKYPDTIFLSEAFTRPKVMYRLAKVGFSQSYTYFTWRHTKQEFIDYLTELTTPAQGSSSPRDFFRPHLFVNTPDINPVFLQRSGRAGFLIRAALAATLSGLWGVYSGFELCEATPVPGKEDYLDSEKYQLRAWHWKRPGNIIAEITALNRIRKENPALHTHLGIRFENAFDPNILYFMKATEDRSNVILVAINLDPYGVHEADFEVPLWAWGRPDDSGVDVTDLLDGHRFRWHGKYQRMRLDPAVNPYAIWRVAL
ncbi:MAG: alpha-1,4-glucan--maltose-1-phosphate maltosyltransferase [Burkholderiaceae bacterium]